MFVNKTFEGILWIGIGLFISILAFQFEIGSFNSPGPGFLPLITGTFILAMGVAVWISRFLSKKKYIRKDKQVLSSRSVSLTRLIYAMALILGFIIFLEYLGFMLVTFLSMFGLFFDFEKKNFRESLLFSCLTSFLSYLIFEVWLRCQLPKGIFPWW
jgi:putative tricarboxylic transport membrane protein